MANDIIFKIKDKFGRLLFHLMDSGFSCAQIEHTIIHDPYFLFFERNDVNVFLDMPMEDIIEQRFHKKVWIDHTNEIRTEIYWAGQMYICLLANYGIPIQRSLLICPILKMASWFNPYHEMNEGRLCERYLEEERKTSILKMLMDGKTNVRKLADITQIKERTLISYLNNERLFAASFSNIYDLSSVFDVPVALFAKQSSYRPIVPSLLKDERFLSLMVQRIASLDGIAPQRIDVRLETPEKKDLRASIAKGHFVLDLYQNVIYRKGNTPIVIKEEELRFLYALAVEDLKKQLSDGSLVF